MKPASIRTYLLMLVVVASVPLVTAAIYDVFEDLEDARENSRTTLRTLAITTVGNTTARLNAIHESLQRLAWKRLPQDGVEQCQATLDDFLPSCSHCVDLFLTSPSGEITCASRLPTGGRRTGTTFDAAWRSREGAPNRFDITASYFDEVLDQVALMVRIPLEGGAGTLHASLRVDVLDPHIPTNFLPPETRFGFISETGVIIWRNQDPEHVNATAPDGGAQMSIVNRHDGEFEGLGLDGLNRMFSVVPMPDTRWVGFISVPISWVNEEPIDRAKSTARTAVLAIIALVALGVLMARRITQPVVELQRVARRAQHGDLEAQARVQGPQELAAVAEALNELVVARRHSERELRAFLENSAVIAWMKDEQGRYAFASDNLVRRFGFTREQMMGRTDAELWPAEVVSQFRETDAQSLDGNPAVEFVQRLPNPDGTWSTWLTHKFIFRRADGQALVGGLAVDITDLEQAEMARRVADESLTQTFTTSPIGMALRTLDDRFFRVNESLCRMLGYSEAELLAVRSHDLTAEVDRDRANAEAGLLLAGKTESVQSEKRYVHKLGHDVWVHRTLSLVRDEKGQPLHFLAQVQDISERKSAETSARLAVVGTLAAGAAHEINNPLTYILGNLTWVQDELKELVPSLAPQERPRLEETLEALHEAHGGAERIARIIAGLKSFSRKSDEPLAPTDVVKVMQSALHLTEAQRRNQARTVTTFGDVPLVKASSHQLEQVFINLLVNAAQAIPEESDAEAHRITVVTELSSLGEVSVEVQDTGVGITDEVLPHIFEPFFTTKPVGSGTGLGLPTCHGIITSFGGRIEVDSTPGKGSTFRVVLPALPRSVSLPAPVVPEGMVPLPQKGRVLIIDDDAAVANSIARALRGGPEVMTLTDAREALRQLQDGERFDLVLCDLMMPALSGEEFQKQLEGIRPQLAQSLVFLTGGAFTAGATTFLGKTTNLCLQKPVETNALRRAVAERLTQI